MNPRVLGFLFVAAAAITASFFFSPGTHREIVEPPNPDAPWDERVAHWKHEVERDGGAAAYATLAEYLAGYPIQVQHEQAHAFGSALFTVEGTSGIGVCDTRFSFGCFHQFLGEAIAALGLESVPKLNAECFDALEKTPLSCQHGIGHGVVAAVGYTDDDMRRSLEICRDLPGTDPIGGCYGGVFMEYNVRTMLADQASAREYEGNPFAPCDALADEFVVPCIYWQPQWWLQTSLLGMSAREQFESMGDYCREFVHTPVLERACFEGVGNVVIQSSDFDATEATTLCHRAGITGREQLLCLSIAANHFGIDVSQEDAARVCEGLDHTARDYCLAYARNELNIANTGIFPL